MWNDRTVWYRGAWYQLGRARHRYAIWMAGGPRSRPVEQWPETPEGWAAAWSRFTAVEAPGTITHLAPPAEPPSRVNAALILLAAGLACGVAGLFPAYLSGDSLVRQAYLLVPHLVYLATWAASAALIVAGNGRRRAGVLLGLGTGVLTFGFFLVDIGLAAAGAVAGPGLVLSLAGWLACTAGCAALFLPWRAELPTRLRGRPVAGGRAAGLVTVATLAAVGAAIAFAPSWDRYTLHSAAGLTQSVTLGNAFSTAGLMTVGNVVVMVTLVVVVALAALWRPPRLGAALFAGALLPMVATAVSAIIQISQPLSPSAFHIPPAVAARAGVTVSAGLTAAFWVYCVFLVALALAGAGLLLPRAPRRPGWYPAQPGGGPAWQPPAGGPAWQPAGGPAWPPAGGLARPDLAPETPPPGEAAAPGQADPVNGGTARQ